MSVQRPGRFNLPDLSGLDDNLTANLVLSLTVGRGFPPGDGQHLVIAFIRTTEGALRRYEEARLRLERSAEEDSLVEYLRGLDDMELTFLALHRAMRLAEGLMRSPETKVGNRELPGAVDRDQLRKMRNAIDHRDQPIIAGLAGKQHTLALLVREHDMIIDDDEGTRVVTHANLGDWIRRLHALAVDLTNHPERWVRT